MATRSLRRSFFRCSRFRMTTAALNLAIVVYRVFFGTLGPPLSSLAIVASRMASAPSCAAARFLASVATTFSTAFWTSGFACVYGMTSPFGGSTVMGGSGPAEFAASMMRWLALLLSAAAASAGLKFSTTRSMTMRLGTGASASPLRFSWAGGCMAMSGAVICANGTVGTWCARRNMSTLACRLASASAALACSSAMRWCSSIIA